MEVDVRGTVVYPMLQNHNPAIMSIRAPIAQQKALMKPFVRAATLLHRNSSTEIIEAHNITRRNFSVSQYVDIAESEGRLYCVSGELDLAGWVKNVTFAKDCQSSNVMLMNAENGVYLKAIRIIHPGEPLLMWFTENILSRMEIDSYLKPFNIRGQNLYSCHICNVNFEFPNPLKIHIALKCNRLEMNDLWRNLSIKIQADAHPRVPLDLFPQKIPPTFNFELTASPQISPAKIISPIKVETLNSSASLTNTSVSPTSPKTPPSPRSLGDLSSGSSTQVSPISSSTGVSPIRKTSCQNSAFKPYITKPIVFNTHTDVIHGTPRNYHHHHHHHHVVPSIPLSVPVETHAAHMETIVSNLGKSKQGHLCIYCGKIYSRKYGLKIHIRTHTGYKPLKCKYCLRPFGDPSNLNKHVRLHADGETPYKCDICGKVLVRRRDLERHIRSRHHSENHGHTSDAESEVLDV